MSDNPESPLAENPQGVEVDAPSPQSTPRRVKLSAFIGVGLLVLLLIIAGTNLGYLVGFAHRSVPTPTPASKANVSHSTSLTSFVGRVIYHDVRDGISVSDVNGDDVHEIVPGPAVGFAGINAAEDALYYVEPDVATHKYKLVKYALNNSYRTVLFEFPRNIDPVKVDSSDLDEFAKVSPDEKRAVIISDTGIDEYLLPTGTSHPFIKNPPYDNPVAAQIYTNPRWSPDGSAILASVDHYEWTTTVVVDVATGSILNQLDGCVSYFTKQGHNVFNGGPCGEGPSLGASYYPGYDGKPMDLIKLEWKNDQLESSDIVPLPDDQVLVQLNYNNYNGTTQEVNSEGKAWVINPVTEAATPAKFEGADESFDSATAINTQNILVSDFKHNAWRINIVTGQRTKWAQQTTGFITYVDME